VTRGIKADTGVIRDDTAAIKQDTTLILQQIAQLKAQLSEKDATLVPTVDESGSRLSRYLADLTSYAETVCWSGEDSDTEADIGDGNSTPLGAIVLPSSSEAHLPDMVSGFRDLMRDPLLIPTATLISPDLSHGTPIVQSSNTNRDDFRPSPVRQSRTRVSSKNRITQRVKEKLQPQVQVEADSIDHRRLSPQDIRTLDGRDTIKPRKSGRKSDRGSLLGAARSTEKQVEKRHGSSSNRQRTIAYSSDQEAFDRKKLKRTSSNSALYRSKGLYS
jgi:hypothetical protein